jgi:hypothetical protein
MPQQDRRSARRLIMKVPLRFRPMQAPADVEQTAASMKYLPPGRLFLHGSASAQGVMIQVHLKMPREVVGDDVREWCFTGRVAHVELLGTANDKLGVGVQFLYYEVPRASL